MCPALLYSALHRFFLLQASHTPSILPRPTNLTPAVHQQSEESVWITKSGSQKDKEAEDALRGAHYYPGVPGDAWISPAGTTDLLHKASPIISVIPKSNYPVENVKISLTHYQNHPHPKKKNGLKNLSLLRRRNVSKCGFELDDFSLASSHASFLFPLPKPGQKTGNTIPGASTSSGDLSLKYLPWQHPLGGSGGSDLDNQHDRREARPLLPRRDGPFTWERIIWQPDPLED
ncbi:hypothetical protein E2C01_005858 [Portunus trituberculatus]|uniref:Uncharacterized protein n=1 Tax=Portunus trituberculatus TaxID=210409 RepID=A0A5B7CTH1_PORTR|nr:hypothetical protein [Portunus trituberculatus]